MFTELFSMPMMFAQAKKQQKMANAIKPVRVDYKISDYAKQMMGDASLAMNGRMPGAAAAEANIGQSQVNAVNATGRGATSAAQFLALAAAAQGNTNQAFGNLGVAEAQDMQRRLANKMNAQNVMIGEDDKVYNDRMQKYLEESQTKAQLQQSADQNRFNAVSSIGGFLDSAANTALSMYSGGMLGGKGKGGSKIGGADLSKKDIGGLSAAGIQTRLPQYQPPSQLFIQPYMPYIK